LNNLQKHIEVILFASEQSVNIAELQTLLSAYLKEEITEEQIIESIATIKERYSAEDAVFELVEISNGYQFLSKKEYHALLNLLIIHREKKKLSTAAMETLAIIAYKQPITKSEVELIRGVNCDYSVQKLLEKDLISISGRSTGPGKPILYETSVSFMDHFGLKSTKDLPQLKDIQNLDNTINPEDSTTINAESISMEEAHSIELAQSDESESNSTENLSSTSSEDLSEEV
jgi:segregation and condensation protein B